MVEKRSVRSEEHTSELQSHLNLVCRLLLEKKKQHKHTTYYTPHYTYTHSYTATVQRTRTTPLHPCAPPPTHPPARTHTSSLTLFFIDTPTPEISPFPLHAPLPT